MNKLRPPKGKRLTQAATQDYVDWAQSYNGCTCYITAPSISAPCGSCVHPGNPANLNEDEAAWEWDAIDLDEMVADAQAVIRATIHAHAKLHKEEMALRQCYFEFCVDQDKPVEGTWLYNKELFNYYVPRII